MSTFDIQSLKAYSLEDTTLRDYQQDNKQKIYDAWGRTNSVMLQMPTGTGKTRLFVSIIKDTIDTDGKSAVYFYFTQPLDHQNPAAGTFKQYCVLHYEHPDSITVLHTQGYSIPERKSFRQLDLSRIFGGNYLEVEHRYYKRSEIGDSQEDFTKTSYWDYNTAAQSTADLHDIVTTLKATKAFNGKWVSSGVSKNGILTALYAYYYPNEVDVYVPFCAPFCTELESPGKRILGSSSPHAPNTRATKADVAINKRKEWF